MSFYEEHFFHDNPEDAQWFHDHMRDVARSAVQGMCDYLGIPFVEPTEDEVIDTDYNKLKDEYNALYASTDALITRLKNAIEIFEKGKD